MWVAVGPKLQANRQRISMKMRLNHPLALVFGAAPASVTANAKLHAPEGSSGRGVGSLPPGIHLQSLRATSPATATNSSSEVLVRFQHLWAAHEDPALSVPQPLDIAKLFSTAAALTNISEVSLSGLVSNAEAQATRLHFPVQGEVLLANGTTVSQPERDAESAAPVVSASAESDFGYGGTISIKPFELRTFVADLGAAGSQGNARP
jgi:hypothetical protein